MQRSNFAFSIIWTVTVLVCSISYVACNNYNNSATFSGKLIDVEGKPISEHVVTLYPIEMSEGGSAIYHPLMNIATSPGFMAAHTNRDGAFAFTDEIKPEMIRLGLISSKVYDKLRKHDLEDSDLIFEYDLVSIKIGVMTFYADEHGPGSTTFSLQTDRKIENAVITARPEMWIKGKILFSDKKPLTDATATFKIQFRGPDKSGGGSYNDRIHKTDGKGNFMLGLFYHSEPRLYKVSVEYQGLSATSEEFLIQGGGHLEHLILKLNGNKDAIPNDPKPPQPQQLPGMMPLPQKIKPEQWIVNPANGHAYIKIICQNYEVAKDQAAAERGYLVAINDEAEQKWISGVFGNHLYWIGLNNTETDRQWQWDNGDPITYDNWGPKDRFSRDYLTDGEKIAGIMTFVDGEWHAVGPGDLFWDVTKMAILEKDDFNIGTSSEDR